MLTHVIVLKTNFVKTEDMKWYLIIKDYRCTKNRSVRNRGRDSMKLQIIFNYEFSRVNQLKYFIFEHYTSQYKRTPPQKKRNLASQITKLFCLYILIDEFNFPIIL